MKGRQHHQAQGQWMHACYLQQLHKVRNQDAYTTQKTQQTSATASTARVLPCDDQ